MEKPLRYLFARKKLSDSSSLLYFVGTGSVDGKEIWAYTTDENAEVDPGAVAEKTMWTVCRGPSCDFDADAMGDTAAIAGALAESAS